LHPYIPFVTEIKIIVLFKDNSGCAFTKLWLGLTLCLKQEKGEKDRKGACGKINKHLKYAQSFADNQYEYFSI
jgi:hypothetical protein